MRCGLLRPQWQAVAAAVVAKCKRNNESAWVFRLVYSTVKASVSASASRLAAVETILRLYTQQWLHEEMFDAYDESGAKKSWSSGSKQTI